jgi:hypothetical protein
VVNAVLADAGPQSDSFLGPSLEGDRTLHLANDYLSGQTGSATEVTSRLAQSGLGAEAFDGQAIREALSELECLDRLIAASDLRRDAILRDLDRRRERSRSSARPVLDAEFEPAPK